MKMLVTGGAGFIGSNFITYWLKKNSEDTIINVDSLTYAGNLENLTDIQNNKQYSFIKADVCDKAVLDPIIKGVDIVIHFAAESHVDRSIIDADPFVKTNVAGTLNLLKLSLKHNIKWFHHVSTDEVFGSLELGSINKFEEQTPYDPRSPYAASKASSDHLVRAFHYTYGLPITISNCSNNFGPYQFPEKLIPLAITNILEDKMVPVYGDGLYVRDWLYVEDHCEAIEAILRKGKIGETYLIGGLNEDIPNIEVIKKILFYMGKDESMIEFVKDRPGHDRRYSINWNKINKKLGWKPKHSCNEALEETIAWYKSNESWWKHVKSGEYKDYYQKQYNS